MLGMVAEGYGIYTAMILPALFFMIRFSLCDMEDPRVVCHAISSVRLHREQHVK